MQCFGSGPIWVFFKGSRSTSLECAVRCVCNLGQLSGRRSGGHFGGRMLSRKDEEDFSLILPKNS